MISRSGVIIAALAALLLPTFATSAQAATVQVAAGIVYVSDDTVAGETNAIGVRFSAGDPTVFEITDTSTALTLANGSCSLTGTTPADIVVSCPGATSTVVTAGKGNDTVKVRLTDGIVSTLNGGPGDDILEGGAAGDSIDGQGGADRMLGNAGGDFFSDSGSDASIDKVSYNDGAHAASAVNASFDGQRNDGDATVDGASSVTSGAGNDIISSGIERIDGGPMGDTITGGSDADILVGGGGDDTLTGNGGKDVFEGDLGADTINASDGLADEQIDCDNTVQTAAGDTANLDALDPAPTNCETVNRPSSGGGTTGGGGGDAGGGGDTTTTTPTPKGSGPVMVVGNPVVGETLFCDPGGIKGTLDYTWFMIGKDGSGANSPIGRQQTFKLTDTQVGFGVECFVHAAGTGQGVTSENRPIVVERKVAPFTPSFSKALRNYLRGTKICGSKGYCTSEQVRLDLIEQGVNLKFPDPKTVEHRSQLPKSLRDVAEPGEVIEVKSSPGDGVHYTTGPTKVVTVQTTIFDPVIPSKVRCPFNADLVTVGDRDFQLPDLLIGLSWLDAKALLKKEHCYRIDADGDETRVEYSIEAEKTSGKVADPIVTGARVIKDADAPHKRLVALTVTRPKAELGLLLGSEYKQGSVGLGNDDSSLTVMKGVKNAFSVTVTYNGISFANARVELRDPDGIVVDIERTDSTGTAHFNTQLTRAGRYELWALMGDRSGDTLVGYESKIPGIARRGASFVDGLGIRWVSKNGSYDPQAALRAHAAAADPGVEKVKAIAKQMQVAATINWIPLLVDQTVKLAFYGDKAFVDTAFVNLTVLVTALNKLSQDGCIACAAQLGVTFPLLTLGGSSPTVNPGTASVLQGLTFNGRTASLTKIRGITPGDGALVVRSGPILMLADGSYIVAQGGGNIISTDGASITSTVVDANRAALTPSVLGGYIVSTSGSGIISNDGGSLISNDGGSIVAQGGGNIISNDGASALPVVGGSILSEHGAGIIADNGGG